MNFTPNKTPVETISEGAFGGTYFRDIYSGVNGVSCIQVIIMMLGLINTV